MPDTLSLRDRYRGAMLGLACRDAVGTRVEFQPRGSFEPVQDMLGGGPFDLAPGQWTDDTSMALCLTESLIRRRGFDPRDQMVRYVNWWQWGYLSATGECFDIGSTVLSALQRFEATGNPNAGVTAANTAGNGSLMRLAPVALFFFPDRDAVLEHSALSSITTHAAPEAVDCCRLLGLILCDVLDGGDAMRALEQSAHVFACPRVCAIAQREYRDKTKDQIRGTGYAVESLEAALWCFANTGSFEEAVLMAANLGDDADTTAAIVGQIAGAHYGAAGIPAHWLEKLHMRSTIAEYSDALFDIAVSARESAG